MSDPLAFGPINDPGFYNVDPIQQQGGGDWFGGALQGLANTAVGAGNAAINAWASGFVSDRESAAADRQAASGNTPQVATQASLFPGGNSAVLIAVGLGGLALVLFGLRR